MICRNFAYKRTETSFGFSVTPLTTMTLRTLRVPRLECLRRHLRNAAVRIRVACSMSGLDCANPNEQYVSNVPMNTNRKRHHTPCIANFMNSVGLRKFRIKVNLSFDAVLFLHGCHEVSEVLRLPRPGLARLRAL